MTFKQLLHRFGYSERAYSVLFALSTKVKNLEDYLECANEEVDVDVGKYGEIMNSVIPIERICGKVLFWRREFILLPNVFCPRYETEKMIEEIEGEVNLAGTYIDICAGNGVIGISVKKIHPNLRTTLLDIDPHAVENIRINAKKHNVKVNIVQEDWVVHLKNNRYEFISANFPYIGKNDCIDEDLTEYEPKLALFSGCDTGWCHYQKLLDFLSVDEVWRLVWLECNSNHEYIWEKAKNKYGRLNIKKIRDESGLLRIVRIDRKN